RSSSDRAVERSHRRDHPEARHRIELGAAEPPGHPWTEEPGRDERIEQARRQLPLRVQVLPLRLDPRGEDPDVLQQVFRPGGGCRAHQSGCAFMVETWAAITFQPRSGKRTHVWLWRPIRSRPRTLNSRLTVARSRPRVRISRRRRRSLMPGPGGRPTRWAWIASKP